MRPLDEERFSKDDVDYTSDRKWEMTRPESMGEFREDAPWPLPTRLRVIVGLVVGSWIVIGLAAYAVVEILAR
jgi:hypothetical protein